MTLLATKLLRSHELKIFRETSKRVLKMSFGSGEPCPPPPPCPCPPAKPEPLPSSPEPPPCPKLPPPCPPPMCAKIPDPANPCNYCPPTCIDPTYPDLTRLKRNQCKFQEDNGLPVYLKGGTMDTILYQGTILIVTISVLLNFYTMFTIKK